jgi:amidase
MSHLIDLDATDQLAALRAGWLTVPELAEMTLDRIDGRNAGLNAVISLRDRDAVMAEAVRLQSEPPRGPLHGLPMAIKDLTETAGVRTTYGFLGTRDFVPAEDSPMVARLRAAGALVIGKTNTPEFGLGSHSYNRVSGVTRNPYDPSRSAGGS